MKTVLILTDYSKMVFKRRWTLRQTLGYIWLKKYKESVMIKKRILDPSRVRQIDGGFSYIPHRFLTEGFLAALSQKELLLYLFLVVASDRYGLSFYSYDTTCGLLGFTLDQYTEARCGLIKKDLIAFDGTLFQVLALPQKSILKSNPKAQRRSFTKQDPTAMSQLTPEAIHEGWKHKDH